MPTVVWVIAGIGGLLVLDQVYLYLREKLWPFEYRQVPFEELPSHIEDVCRRGQNKSELIITDEASGNSVRVRKTYRYRAVRNLRFKVIATDVTSMRCPSLCSHEALGGEIEKLGVKIHFGNARSRESCIPLLIDCGDDIDKVIAVTSKVLGLLLGSLQEATFRIRVNGRIMWADVFWADPKSDREHWSKLQHREYKYGRPYKHWQVGKGKVAERLGRAVGSFVRGLFWFLFPRGPEDRL